MFFPSKPRTVTKTTDYTILDNIRIPSPDNSTRI